MAHVIIAVGEAEAALGRGRDHHGTALEVGGAAEVEHRVPAVVVPAGEGARKSLARGDRINAGQLVLQGVRAGALDGRRIDAGRVERAQLLVGRLGGDWYGCGEPLRDAAQGGVVPLHQLGEAAEARVFGRQRGAGQPAAVRVAVKVLAGGASGIQVHRIQAVVRGLGRGARGEREYEKGHEQTVTAGHPDLLERAGMSQATRASGEPLREGLDGEVDAESPRRIVDVEG